MKVVITDYTFPSLEIEQGVLQDLKVDLVGAQCKDDPERLKALVADADAVITQFASINADVISSMKKARVIVRYGIGVDNVDLLAARRCGIPVCNVPDYCIDEVADHTLAFMLAITRGVVQNNQRVHSGGWGLAVPLDRMWCMRDLTVGIVGFGRIGREVASRLAAFKCRRVVYDPMVNHEVIRDSGCQVSSLDELLSVSDVITLHCPSTEQTRKMLNRERLRRVKRGAVLINVGRGDLVCPDALTDALREGQLSAAGLDVFQPEPVPSGHPILAMDQVVIASHVASASVPAVRKLRETAAHLAAMALLGRELPNVVN